jgi:hypothetical protein
MSWKGGGLEFRVKSSKFKVQSSKSKVQSSAFKVGDPKWRWQRSSSPFAKGGIKGGFFETGCHLLPSDGILEIII